MTVCFQKRNLYRSAVCLRTPFRARHFGGVLYAVRRRRNRCMGPSSRRRNCGEATTHQPGCAAVASYRQHLLFSSPRIFILHILLQSFRVLMAIDIRRRFNVALGVAFVCGERRAAEPGDDAGRRCRFALSRWHFRLHGLATFVGRELGGVLGMNEQVQGASGCGVRRTGTRRQRRALRRRRRRTLRRSHAPLHTASCRACHVPLPAAIACYSICATLPSWHAGG